VLGGEAARIAVPVFADHAERAHAAEPVEMLDQQRLGSLASGADARRRACRATADHHDVIFAEHGQRRARGRNGRQPAQKGPRAV